MGKAGQIVHIGKYEKFNDLDSLMRKFNISRCVVDALPETRLAREFAGCGGRIDAIVNNAMLLRYGPLEAVTPENLSAMLDVGIKAMFWSAQALLAHYDPERGACLINMASPVARTVDRRRDNAEPEPGLLRQDDCDRIRYG